MAVLDDFIQQKDFLRLLEIGLGLTSINILLFPFWGSFVLPNLVAYVVLAFDVLWLYKSGTTALAALHSHHQLEKSKKMDWLNIAQKHPGFAKINHIVIIPNANEPLNILRRSLRSLASQTFPKDRLWVVLAMEAREVTAKGRAQVLLKEFQKELPHLFYTLHNLQAGEIIGKSSNEAYAGRWIYEKVVAAGVDPQQTTITTADCDAVLHPQYFAYLTSAFLNNPQRHRRLWQGALVFYNNIERLPSPNRVVAIVNTIWQIAQLSRRDRLINISTYSLSLKMLQEVGFWDTDVIPEDYRLFFKCFFKLGGTVEVEPIFLPVSLDAAESATFMRTLKNQYFQQQRWAWGISDDPLLIKWWLISKNIPWGEKTVRVLKVLLDHLFWPANWVLITLGANLPLLLNPRFSQTILGQQLPRISSFILTTCLLFLAIMIYVDYRQRPAAQKPRLARKVFQLWEWSLMPVVGLFLGALPGLDAHLHLLLGKYLEYRVTEKV